MGSRRCSLKEGPRRLGEEAGGRRAARSSAGSRAQLPEGLGRVADLSQSVTSVQHNGKQRGP